jgi:hypothetical protein
MNQALGWLMEGDPAIRWQTLRDLLDAPAAVWEAERQQTLETGWGARLLGLQDANGGWGGGVYSPKWISTTYTLLTVHSIGIPPGSVAGQRGTRLAVSEMLGETNDTKFARKLARLDRCIVGMLLQLSVYFGIQDERVGAMVDNLLAETMPDGGWNCDRLREPRPTHSSFHTTLNVLEGLREYVERGEGDRREDVRSAERNAQELLLQHRLFRSDRTGEIIHPKFVRLSFPPRWHYDMLRGLAYFARAGADRDRRLLDAIDLLVRRRDKDGRWPVQQKHAGKVFFDMEEIGGSSRWNTLRALRVCRWWEG